MKHTTHVKNYAGPHEQLAEEIGDLFYDSLADFLRLLAAKADRDSHKDEVRGRQKLAAELQACADHLNQSALHIDAAWKICEPHVRK